MAAGLLDMHNSRREELYFFFQAEDGIRGWSVTGVQTCALPISRLDVPERVLDAAAEGRDLDAARVHLIDHVPGREIGRASCRERAYLWVRAGPVQRRRRNTGEIGRIAQGAADRQLRGNLSEWVR